MIYHKTEITKSISKYRHTPVGCTVERTKLNRVEIKTTSIHQHRVVALEILCLFHTDASYLYFATVVVEDNFRFLCRQWIDYKNRCRLEPYCIYEPPDSDDQRRQCDHYRYFPDS